MYKKLRRSITATTSGDIISTSNTNNIYTSTNTALTEDTGLINVSTHSSSASIFSTTTTATAATTAATSTSTIIDFDYNGYATSSNHLLNEITKTQMFHNFINEKIDNGTLRIYY